MLWCPEAGENLRSVDYSFQSTINAICFRFPEEIWVFSWAFRYLKKGGNHIGVSIVYVFLKM
jgi:hypothetical protein